jgi:hypothetical protein
MRNMLGLLLALAVALGLTIGTCRLLGASTAALSLACLGVGMAVTAIYDAHFGTR